MGKLYVVSGPSGSGKSTLCKNIALHDNKIKLSVSATTRSPRQGEIDGKDYFFLTDSEFDDKIDKGLFYEHADIFGKRYGTLKDQTDALTNSGLDVILEIDVQGAKQVKSVNDKAILIFIMPPSIDELVKRLKLRATESDEQLSMRIKTAKSEMAQRDMYDYVIINDDLNTAYEELASIIKKYR